MKKIGLIVVVALASAVSAHAQLSQFEAPFSNGGFIFGSIKWVISPDHPTPWFESTIRNESGTRWERITFRVKVTGPDDREYSFEATPPLGFPDNGPGNAAVSIAHAYPPSALPAKAAAVEVVRGVQIVPTPAKIYDGPVVKDRACRKDYVDALQLSGLAQRKRIAELVTFECLELSGDAEIASISDSEVVSSGPRSEKFSLAFLVSIEGTRKMGWVLTREIGFGMRDHLVAYPPKPAGK